MENTELQLTEGAFSTNGFEHAQRVAKMLCSSDLVPKEFRGNVQNTLIALEMANRIGASPLSVMQNLYIVHGKPGWSSSFIIAAINSSKRFKPLRFLMTGEGEEYGCTAWTFEVDDTEKLEGPKVTMKMAKSEGWLDKAGSKWKTMPELMLRYRAAAFFGRLYAPDIMMGMQTHEEIIDITPEKIDPLQLQASKEKERLTLMIGDAANMDELEALSGEVMDAEQLELFNTKRDGFKTV